MHWMRRQLLHRHVRGGAAWGLSRANSGCSSHALSSRLAKRSSSMNPIGLNRHRGAFVRYSGLRPRRDRVDLQFRLSHRIRRILQSGMRMCSEQDLAARLARSRAQHENRPLDHGHHQRSRPLRARRFNAGSSQGAGRSWPRQGAGGRRLTVLVSQQRGWI